ncbi:DUF1398 domain-containing protein [Moheibacter sediminis]|uniref:Uncharacterized conserved protein YbcV, DUF1398 family n=1 Tax=Moheibacter sediminis TaxID=1434700 RepID=A0A1W2BPW7_9FLAO|nr:DUF1398 domain-containing protein [Moheibacter sediminis]SMC74682.1 Uncharacterized conserved protein YbcV, DUF1398 family [Moheibacter sediminis]
MFSIEDIQNAHAKVKSGADFPAYIQDLKKLGVIRYETFVSDGHTVYLGENEFRASSPAKYDEMKIADNSDAEQFKSDLKSHQQGNTDYKKFCSDCAKSGIEKWIVDLEKMTCTYYDKSGNEILVETIPG